MMNSFPEWQYDELKQVGIDYTEQSEVHVYDTQMQRLRDIKKEVEDFMKSTGLTYDRTVLEIGTGTGELAIEIARYCTKVFAADVSPTMLKFARQKARDRDVSNIEFHDGGFLTYTHAGEPLDVIVSQLALHHLPDFWKLIALKRIYAMLKNGGKFYLRDVVYSFEGNHHEFFESWINGVKEAAGERMAKDLATSIKEEYYTFDWIMEELLQRAGFIIEKAEHKDGFMAVYLCSKVED
ncbi:MAG: class I SAM-dependent methyltransferase [Candidatus Methanoperedens sp.]|nr:class I SAM-dependent methyltransferase [Candidatus Methanoperedens sp.]